MRIDVLPCRTPRFLKPSGGNYDLSFPGFDLPQNGLPPMSARPGLAWQLSPSLWASKISISSFLKFLQEFSCYVTLIFEKRYAD